MTTSTSASSRATPATAPARRRDPIRALAVLGAALAAAVVWAVTVPLLDVDLRVDVGGAQQAVGLGQGLGTALTAGLPGWLLLAVLERRGRRPVRVWTTTALAVTLLSLAGPLAFGVTTGARVVLVLLHLVVAGVLVPALRGSAR